MCRFLFCLVPLHAEKLWRPAAEGLGAGLWTWCQLGTEHLDHLRHMGREHLSGTSASHGDIYALPGTLTGCSPVILLGYSETTGLEVCRPVALVLVAACQAWDGGGAGVSLSALANLFYSRLDRKHLVLFVTSRLCTCRLRTTICHKSTDAFEIQQTATCKGSQEEFPGLVQRSTRDIRRMPFSRSWALLLVF